MKFLIIVAVTLAIPLAINLITAGNSYARQATTTPGQINAKVLRPLLNSERIKLKFGSYMIAVMQADKRLRVSNLYSSSNGIDTTRTLAVVSYPEAVPAALSALHEEIVSGQSLGAVFKRNGWQIDKQHLYFGEVETADELAGVYRMMGKIKPTKLAIHLYQFKVAKAGQGYHYATIAEIHHPDYLTASQLKAIYPKDFDKHSAISKDTLDETLGAIAKVVTGV